MTWNGRFEAMCVGDGGCDGQFLLNFHIVNEFISKNKMLAYIKCLIFHFFLFWYYQYVSCLRLQ